MTRINLLPDDFRENIAFSRKNKGLLGYIYVLIALCIILIASFGLGTFYLSKSHSYFKNLISENTELTKDYQGTLSSAQQLEERVKTIRKIKGGYKYWSKLDAILWDLAPADIYINSVDTKENVINISGFAKTKTAVADFQENLLKSKAFDIENVETITKTDPSDPDNFRLKMFLEKPAYTSEDEQ